MEEHMSERYFEFINKLGMTKHYGSIDATRELAQACGITRESYVLDVGCGVGATPAFLAKTFGCRVMGVDIIEGMLEQSRARAKAAGVEALTDFRRGDARSLPFADNTFDVVITESLLIFFQEKEQALREFVRVCKPGGVVGLSEMIWLQPEPPENLEKIFRELLYAESVDEGAYVDMMSAAGLGAISSISHKVNMRDEGRGRLQRYGFRGTLGIMLRILKLFLTDRDAWMFVKGGLGGVSEDMFDLMGYGIFTGRKS